VDDIEVAALREDLAGFVADVFASLTRAGWQQRASQYVQGLMLDGRRKSIQPMAARMHAVHDQALNHFVTNSPWDVTAVRLRLAQRLDPVIGTQAWAIDDTGWLKCGTASPGVARQYTGLTLYGVLRRIQKILARLIGRCPTCDTLFPTRQPRAG
jgi:SRSO17 transposase